MASVIVYLGMHKTSSSAPEFYTTSDFYPNPGWNPKISEIEANIALIKLPRPISFTG